jgi:hypothetical protein
MNNDILPPKRSRIQIPVKTPEDEALEIEKLTLSWLNDPKFTRESSVWVNNDQSKQLTGLKYSSKKKCTGKRIVLVLIAIILFIVTGYVCYSSWVMNNRVKSQIQQETRY